MNDATAELVVERDEGLAILRLNRPERLNALSPGILEGLASAVPRLVAAPDVRAIMITGTGKAFCAGGDVGSMGGPANAAATLTGMRSFHPWLNALWASDKLVITAVNGAAAGGGFGIALLGDLVVASDDAFFKAAFTALGTAADFALGFTLPRSIGTHRAAEILFNDRRVTAQEGLALGFVSRVLPARSFATDVLECGRALARAPRGARLTKRLLRFEQAEAFARYLEAEALAQVEAFQSEDFREGVAAFRERRAAVFRGR